MIRMNGDFRINDGDSINLVSTSGNRGMPNPMKQRDPDPEWQREASRLDPGWPVAWTRYTAELHERLLRRWIGILPAGSLVLKTDLFEESIADRNPTGRLRTFGWRALGMDVGKGIAAAACRSLRSKSDKKTRVIVTDVRRIGLRDESVDAVFSNSTLDHFKTTGEMETALAELYRVLKPSGLLILTLDNPSNPIVGLRNALPRPLTEALGITHFYIGCTMGSSEAEAKLKKIGFIVSNRGTFMHACRYIAILLLRLGEATRLEWLNEGLLRFLCIFEGLARWPTARWTGHYIYVEARKPE
jgi:SAM-dependent methyltransferase